MKLPALIQAPIGPAATPELVAAVSNAGALGTLAASWTPVADLRRQLRRLTSLTTEPFGVNLVLAFEQQERLRVALEEGARIVSFSWGLDEALIALVHRAGGSVLVQVGDVKGAVDAARAGADGLIVQGVEAGGHVQSSRPLLDLVHDVRRTVDVPLAAAGGIGTAADVAIARSAGADAVACGTVFLAAEEADVHPVYLEHLIAARAEDTIVTTVFDGGWPDAPHRVVRNGTTDAWERAGKPLRGSRPGEGDVVASRGDDEVLRYDDAQPTRATAGAVELMAMYAGASVSSVRRREPAAATVARLSA